MQVCAYYGANPSGGTLHFDSLAASMVQAFHVIEEKSWKTILVLSVVVASCSLFPAPCPLLPDA